VFYFNCAAGTIVAETLRSGMFAAVLSLQQISQLAQVSPHYVGHAWEHRTDFWNFS